MCRFVEQPAQRIRNAQRQNQKRVPTDKQRRSERLQGPYRVPRRRRWALWRVLEKRGASASSQLARYGRATADRAGRAGAAGLNGPGHPVPCWSTLGVKGEMASGAGRAAIGRLRPCGIWPCLASVPSGLEPALQQSKAEQSRAKQRTGSASPSLAGAELICSPCAAPPGIEWATGRLREPSECMARCLRALAGCGHGGLEHSTHSTRRATQRALRVAGLYGEGERNRAHPRLPKTLGLLGLGLVLFARVGAAELQSCSAADADADASRPCARQGLEFLSTVSRAIPARLPDMPLRATVNKQLGQRTQRPAL